MERLEQHLSEVKELIARGWCQHAPARTAEGKDAFQEDPAAVLFCPVGASRKLAKETFQPDYDLDAVCLAFIDAVPAGQQSRMHGNWNPVSTLTSYNDHPDTVQEDVMTTLDAAIAGVAAGAGAD